MLKKAIGYTIIAAMFLAIIAIEIIVHGIAGLILILICLLIGIPLALFIDWCIND